MLRSKIERNPIAGPDRVDRVAQGSRRPLKNSHNVVSTDVRWRSSACP